MTTVEKAILTYEDVTILKIKEKELYLCIPTKLLKQFPTTKILDVKDISLAAKSLIDVNDNFTGAEFYIKTKYSNNLKVIESSDYQYVLKVLIHNLDKEKIDLDDISINNTDLYILSKDDFKPDIQYVEKEVIKEVVVEKEIEKDSQDNKIVKDADLESVLNDYL